MVLLRKLHIVQMPRLRRIGRSFWFCNPYPRITFGLILLVILIAILAAYPAGAAAPRSAYITIKPVPAGANPFQVNPLQSGDQLPDTSSNDFQLPSAGK